MIVYLDASALVKRYLDEPGSHELRAAMREIEHWTMCRIGYAETRRPISVASRGASAPLRRFESDWSLIEVIEIDQPLVEHTAELADEERLGALDALHLAAALSIPARGVVFATWDRDLRAAAARHRLQVLPERI